MNRDPNLSIKLNLKAASLNSLPEQPQKGDLLWGRIIAALLLLTLFFVALIWGLIKLLGSHQSPAPQPIDALNPVVVAKKPSQKALAAASTAGQLSKHSAEQALQARPEVIHSQPDLKPATPLGRPKPAAAHEHVAATSVLKPGPSSLPPMASVAVQSSKVEHAQLSLAMRKLKPVGNLPESISLGAKPLVTVYFFTAYKNLQGQLLRHEWYLGDKPVARVQSRLTEPSQDTYSSKTIDKHMLGDWKVKAVTQSGKVLAVGEFQVVK